MFKRLLVAVALVLGTVPITLLGASAAGAHEPVPTDYCTSSPDSVAGVYDFRHPCAHHDACYQLHTQSREGCDNTFRTEMRSHCTSRHAWYNPLRYTCLGAADTYYYAVRLFGGPYYNSWSGNTPMG